MIRIAIAAAAFKAIKSAQFGIFKGLTARDGTLK
jgi:hypothetical protein